MDGRLLALCLAVVTLVTYFRRSSKSRLPPGPPRIPILGNILPEVQPWRTLHKYAKEYGPVYSLRILSTTLIVVNSYAAASELFENRSSVYSQRISMKMAELCAMDDGILFESNVQRLRQARRLVASGISPRELESYRAQLRGHVVKLLGSFLHTPERFMDHIRHLPGSILLEITYGYKSTGPEDPFSISANTWTENFTAATSVSQYVVNWMPLLAYVPPWFPGAGFRRTAEAWKKQALDFGEEAYQYVLKSMAEGVATPSVVSKAQESKDPYERDVILKSATQMVTGGADTTVSAAGTFMLAMVLNPEAQRKAQEEIDRVVGKDRLPNFSDRPNLPYVEAMMREAIRWRSPIPAVPRNLTKDDVYDGYFIPKDSFVLINFWAMFHDEEVFPDPDTYNPDRWLNVEITKDMDPFNIAFGFGRRECPGKFLAIELFFTIIANILAVYDVTKAKDKDGNEITPPGDYKSGSIAAPEAFVCSIKPRSERALHVLQENLDELAFRK